MPKNVNIELVGTQRQISTHILVKNGFNNEHTQSNFIFHKFEQRYF